MSVIQTNYTSKISNHFEKTYTKKTEAVYSSKTSSKESVVEEYIRKHPNDAAHVNKQVQAGKKVWAKNGVEDVSRDDMSMEEYQKFFHALLDTDILWKTGLSKIRFLAGAAIREAFALSILELRLKSITERDSASPLSREKSTKRKKNPGGTNAAKGQKS